VQKISDKVSMTHWGEKNQLGGFVWHTTGSGKTMTSFKAAQLIAFSKDADKVIFLVDRIELGTQSLKEYRNFAGSGLNETQRQNSVQETEDSHVLMTKLKSADPADMLIVTSIQKMSILAKENIALKTDDMDKINAKRIVFIVDECHRSTFGDMFVDIKQALPFAIFFGFTGTPIHDENKKKMNTTIDIFGDELHRYSIADGIRDKNVLGFDPYQVLTFKDRDIRKIIALHETKAKDEGEALSDEKKKKIYDYFMKAAMTEIEKYIPSSQYWTQEHQICVVGDIVENWITISRNYQFHAIFASSSIPEAIAYYRLFKQQAPHLKVAALFDPNIDNVAGFEFKEDGLVEVIEDYNARYAQNFSLPTFAKMKKDIAARLAHKKPYQRINPEQQIDLLIVVNQMLTGFDSKWINTLYLDKVIEYESIIQAFSRTNRLFGADKPFGTIKYYRKPHTMKDNIEKAVKLYSGDKVFGLFADKLPKNIEMLNSIFNEIKLLFENAGVANFERLPENDEEKAQFALLFNRLNAYLEAAKVQGLSLKRQDYLFENEKGKKFTLSLVFDETTYFILLQRYKELTGNSGGTKPSAIPYDIKGYITEIDTGKIDNDYMNSRFQKYLKLLNNKADAEQMQAVKEELHKTFATLNQEEQKYANIF
ncbi:MAG: type I restriction endonuclease subunit R, partial [Neisseriaceae bacterium]|nr:type I restriction endonuclease subunit R [Neisseriaceae bacterium]